MVVAKYVLLIGNIRCSSMSWLMQSAEHFNQIKILVIGASVREPHTSELNGRFSLYMYMFCTLYVVPYIFDAVI